MTDPIYLFPKRQILDSSNLKEFADNSLMQIVGSSPTGRNHSVKRTNCSFPAITPFPTVFLKEIKCKYVKSRACLGKVITLSPIQKKLLQIHIHVLCDKRKMLVAPCSPFLIMFSTLSYSSFSIIIRIDLQISAFNIFICLVNC